MKPIKRRNFIEKSARGVAGAGILASVSYKSVKDESHLQGSFIHHVFFWLKTPVTPYVRKKFEQALKDLVKVETIVDHHLGIPADTNRDVIDTSYTYSLLATFKNKTDQDVYQTHPIHLKFVEENSLLWERVVVYDTINL